MFPRSQDDYAIHRFCCERFSVLELNELCDLRRRRRRRSFICSHMALLQSIFLGRLLAHGDGDGTPGEWMGRAVLSIMPSFPMGPMALDTTWIIHLNKSLETLNYPDSRHVRGRQ